MHVLGGDVVGNMALRITSDRALLAMMDFKISNLDASNFSQLELKPGPESELDADMRVTFKTAPHVRELNFDMNVTHIGAKTLDRFLQLLDPDGQNASLQTTRGQLGFVRIENLATWVRYENLNMDIDVLPFTAHSIYRCRLSEHRSPTLASLLDQRPARLLRAANDRHDPGPTPWMEPCELSLLLNIIHLLATTSCTITTRPVNIGTKTALEHQMMGEFEPLSEEELLASSVRSATTDARLGAGLDENVSRGASPWQRGGARCSTAMRSTTSKCAKGCLGEAHDATHQHVRPMSDADGPTIGRRTELVAQENADRAAIIAWIASGDDAFADAGALPARRHGVSPAAQSSTPRRATGSKTKAAGAAEGAIAAAVALAECVLGACAHEAATPAASATRSSPSHGKRCSTHRCRWSRASTTP